MFQILLPLISSIIEVFSTAVAFLGIWSQNWYTGEGGSYGIATGCQDKNATATVSEGSFSIDSYCEFSWDDLANNAETLVACMLFASATLGVISLFFVIVMVLGRFCFKPSPFAGKFVAYVTFLQFLSLAGTLIALAGIWSWQTPPGTNVGPTFYLVSAGCLGAFIATILLNWTGKWERRRVNRKKAKKDKSAKHSDDDVRQLESSTEINKESTSTINEIEHTSKSKLDMV